MPEPLGGPYSSIALSSLHVMAMLAVGLVSSGLAWLERPRPPGGAAQERTTAARLGATVGLGAIVALLFFALPGPRAGLEPGLRFLTMTDAVGSRTGEQLPLFSVLGRPSGRPAWEVWGFLAYLLPLAPVGAVLGARRERRAAAWVVAGWSALFGVLAIVQRRYGNDLGAAAAVGFALLLAWTAPRLAARAGLRPALVACVLGLLALAPPLLGPLRQQAGSSVRALRGEYRAANRALSTIAGTLTRFLQIVERVTPTTSGYTSTSELP